MATNRERQKRKRGSRMFHTMLLIFIMFVILIVVVVGLRWMTGSGRNDNPASIAGTELSQSMGDSSSESTENSQPSSSNTQSESVGTDTQEALDTTQLSNENIPAVVTTATDGPFAQTAGTWTLDRQVTNVHLEESGKEYHSLQEMFGTGSGYDGEVTTQPDGAITYYIGTGNGGTGQGEILGGEISVLITPYEPHSDEEEIRTFHLETVEEKQYLVMDFNGEKLCWGRKTAEQNRGQNDMKNYLGIFVVCLIGCYLCIFSFAIFPYLALVIIALILSGIISFYIRQGKKVEELEKRIHSLEIEESTDNQVLTEKENS